MTFRCGIAATVIALLVPIAGRAQETQKVAGQVVDSAGKPVAGADVAAFWGADSGSMQPFGGVQTDKDGRFTLPMQFYGLPQALLAFDKDRKSGGLTVLNGKAPPAKPVEIKLGPVVRVHGEFASKELGAKPAWTNVYMLIDRARILQCSSMKASFSFLLPPGNYQFWGYGADITNLKKDLTLAADVPDLDMKTLDVPATVIARHRGKEPPAWNVTDARGVKKDVKLSDFRGKWVLVEFWGFW
jgi:hypothetical protein